MYVQYLEKVDGKWTGLVGGERREFTEAEVKQMERELRSDQRREVTAEDESRDR